MDGWPGTCSWLDGTFRTVYHIGLLLPTPLLVLYSLLRYSYSMLYAEYVCMKLCTPLLATPSYLLYNGTPVRWYRIPRRSVVSPSSGRSSTLRAPLKCDRGSRRRTAMNTAVPTDLPYSYSLQVHYGRTMPDAPKRNRKAEYS